MGPPFYKMNTFTSICFAIKKWIAHPSKLVKPMALFPRKFPTKSEVTLESPYIVEGRVCTPGQDKPVKPGPSGAAVESRAAMKELGRGAGLTA